MFAVYETQVRLKADGNVLSDAESNQLSHPATSTLPGKLDHCLRDSGPLSKDANIQI